MFLGSCLITTMIWSDGHWSPRRVTALGSWTNHVIALRQISVTALFYLEDSRRIHPRRREESGGARQHLGKGVEKEKERLHKGERERVDALGSSFCVLSPPGPALCKLGSARSAVLPEVLTLVLDLPLTFLCSIFAGFSLACLLASAILDSSSLF